MEPRELSLALLHQAVTVVAVLGELLAVLPGRDKTPLESLEHLYSKLEDFTRGLWATIKSIDDTWWHRDVISNNKAPPTSVSRALAAYKSTPWTTWDDVTMVACEWQGSLNGRLHNWAELARKATKLCNTCREVVTEAAIMVATTTAQARELQAKAAHYGTPQEPMMELGQALGGEEGAVVVAVHKAWVRIEAMEAAIEARRATMERQRLEAALGLLERLEAACDKITKFSWELWCRAVDIEAALEGINEVSSNVPKALVAKVAEAERLWEASARLMKDHLLGTVGDINKFFTGSGASPSTCEVAKRCQRAIKNIQREHPHGVPKVSPVSVEPRELSLTLLKPKPLVTMVTILGELVGITARLDVLLPMCQPSLHKALENFTKNLHDLLRGIAKPFWQRHHHSYLADVLTSLSQALAAYETTSWTSWDQMRSVASEWHELLSTFEDSWAQLTREATKLRDACRNVATGRGITVAMEEILKKGIKEAMGGAIREALEGVTDAGEDVGGTVVAESQVRVVTGMRQRAEEAWGLLKHLVIACRKSTVFYRELRRGAGEIRDAVRGTGEPPRQSRSALAAKVAEVERLWVAGSLLARDHLVVALGDICTIFRCGDPNGSIALEVAEQCQKATEDILSQLQGQ